MAFSLLFGVAIISVFVQEVLGMTEHWQDFDENIWEEILEKNIAAGIIHCRLKYWRVPKKMPSSIEGQADYWKKYYNTEGGKGDPEHFIDACLKYLV